MSEAEQILEAARRFKYCKFEYRPLGPTTLKVLELLVTGRLDLSLVEMSRKLGCSSGTVASALAELRRHGFVDWQQRRVPSGSRGAMKQTTNVYRLTMPAAGSVQRVATAPAFEGVSHL